MRLCVPQTYRFSLFLVIALVASITCQNYIPFTQSLKLHLLSNDDPNFTDKSEAMCLFFEKRGYPVSVA